MLSKSHPFLKEIVQSAGKLPNVICYTDYQMKHFSSACKTSVISVNKTFNLGACFVTTVFQESKLKRKGKNTNPFILGPVYLHLGWCFSYIPKIFHCKGILGANLRALYTYSLTVGIILSVKYAPTDASYLLSIFVTIVSEIFGENGLIEADTTVDFTKLVTNIESKYEASVYLTDKIIPTVRET
jgi:hypothetical protein